MLFLHFPTNLLETTGFASINGAIKTAAKTHNITTGNTIFIGAGLNAGLLWDIADVTMGCMTIINMPFILILSKYAMKALKDYEQQAENGRKPVFHVRDIGLPHEVDYWD